jgi:hypothetical protein
LDLIRHHLHNNNNKLLGYVSKWGPIRTVDLDLMDDSNSRQI